MGRFGLDIAVTPIYFSATGDGTLYLTKDRSYAMVFKKRSQARAGLVKYLKR